jgi:Flp pilus assembly protein TadD
MSLATMNGTPALARDEGGLALASSSRSAASSDRPAAGSRDLYLNLIENMRRSGKAHAALAHLDAFDELYPRSEEAAVLRADCLVDVEDYTAASTIYRKLMWGSATAAAAAGLGRIDALNDRWERAAEYYARAVEAEPTSPIYLNDYGFALLRAGKLEKALFRLKQAAELAPEDARVRNNLALALGATGDVAGARRLVASVPDKVERAELEAELLAQATAKSAPATAAKIPN